MSLTYKGRPVLFRCQFLSSPISRKTITAHFPRTLSQLLTEPAEHTVTVSVGADSVTFDCTLTTLWEDFGCFSTDFEHKVLPTLSQSRH
ncbi:hypothetical protein BaRGS_00025725 [Batillaria attramentaria]|uniref:Uncharacterized protein n=1 Tax=Batillaria attramentaria TaxID=370345 RepID=A0ABD0K7T3_9CAEN